MRTRPQGQPGGRDARNKQRRERHAGGGSGRELLYGRNAVRESLRAGRRRFFRLLIAEGVEQDGRLAEIERLARSRNLPIEQVPRDRLDELAGYGHQGVGLESGPYPYTEDVSIADLARRRSVILALDGIEDPRNAGTLLRTAEAVGVALVVFPSDRAVGITPAVVNASSGAVEHLNIARETNLARWLKSAHAAGFWILGLAGDEGAQPLFSSDTAAPVVLVVGSEAKGIRRLVREQCDLLVSLPMVGKIESLNASVAGSVALYEIFRDSEEIPQ